MNKTMKNIFMSFAILSLVILGGCDTQETPVVEEEIKIVSNNIYEVPKNPTKEQITVFNELSKALTSNASDDEVASLVAVNFAYNFYSLYGKESKSDIGGLQFLPELSREEFSSYASYKYYHNYDTVVSTYGKDDLPNVISHQVKSVSASQFLYNQLQYDGFEVILALNYQESGLAVGKLKSNVTMQIINNNGRYEVIASED